MRFNPNQGKTAKELLSSIEEKELIKIIQIYAEVSHAEKLHKESS